MSLAVVDSSLVGPIINLGAVGACLVILAIYYVKRERKHDERVDERLREQREFRTAMAAVEERFRTELINLTEKYRMALEKFGQTLDAVIRVLSKRERRGDP